MHFIADVVLLFYHDILFLRNISWKKISTIRQIVLNYAAVIMIITIGVTWSGEGTIRKWIWLS